MILFSRYSFQQPLQNLCPQLKASVSDSLSLPVSSMQQMGHSNGSLLATAIRDFVRDGKAFVATTGEVIASSPASSSTFFGSSQYVSVSFSLFHLKWRRSVAAVDD